MPRSKRSSRCSACGWRRENDRYELRAVDRGHRLELAFQFGMFAEQLASRIAVGQGVVDAAALEHEETVVVLAHRDAHQVVAAIEAVAVFITEGHRDFPSAQRLLRIHRPRFVASRPGWISARNNGCRGRR